MAYPDRHRQRSDPETARPRITSSVFGPPEVLKDAARNRQTIVHDRLPVPGGELQLQLTGGPHAARVLDTSRGSGSLRCRSAIGVAILKYRLYDIDRIISRTLAYAIVTGLLVGVYAGLVLLATQVLKFHSTVAVAASTLVAAALFNPVRRRVQHAVDRRFNRARYNAEQW